jgi:subtilase family serine protease
MQLATLTIAIAGVGGASASVAAAASPRARVGSVPQLPRTSVVTGALRPSRRVSFVLALSSRDPLAMQRLATAVSTPGSASYRRYLSVSQFAARFGASDAAIGAVTHALRADGLSVSSAGANHLMLGVAGTVAQVQRAFATQLDAVRMSDGRRAYANRSVPTLPVSIASDVDAVIGLDSIYRPQSDQLGAPTASSRESLTPAVAAHPDASARVTTGGPQPCAAVLRTARGRYPGYPADSIAAAYNFSGLYAAGDHAGGQTVAVYELEKIRRSDIRAYQRCYGTHVKLSYVNTGHPSSNGGDAEAALDLEQIIGLAPRVRLVVYQASDSVASSIRQFNKIVAQNRAHTVSVSWGSCEAKITFFHHSLGAVRAENRIFQEAAIQGQSILSASGDTGSSGCQADLGTTELAVQDPSSQPFATAVGGTTLYTDVANQPRLWNPLIAADPLLQAVWNDGESRSDGHTVVSATTGGISSLWAMPAYQRTANPALGVINAYSSGTPCKSSGDCREVPDVSANADPASGYIVHVSSSSKQSGWTVEGGTSAAAPLWAALTAEADALPACRGAALGFENPSLYDLAAAQPGDINDITGPSPVSGRGDNDGSGKDGGLYPVTAGYDLATGLGTPNAAALAAGLCALRAPVYSVSIAAPASRSVIVRRSIRLRVTGTDSGNLPLHYTARGLPRGVKISRRGVISGRPRRTGSFTVKVTAIDHATNRASAKFTLNVLDSPASLGDVSLTGVAHRRPALSFSVSRGRYAADLRSVTVRLPPGLHIRGSRRGIRVTTGSRRDHVRVRRVSDGLTITLAQPRDRVRVTIAHPTLAASRSLAVTARTDHGAKVRVRIDVTDQRRRTTPRSTRLRLR